MGSILISIIAAVVVALLALYLGQRKILFPAPNVAMPAIQGGGVEVIELELGGAILALPIEPTAESGAGAPLIVFAHGNGEVAHWSLEDFRVFREEGFAVLLLEYPGYGGTPGSPSSKSLGQAALLALDAVADRTEVDAERIVVYGRSIGSGVACQIAEQRDVVAIVLESPFTSLRSLVAEKGLPAFLLRDAFDNGAALGRSKAPVFLYHGTRDELIPVSHSRALAETAAGDVTFVTEDCGHNDCPRPWPELLAFFSDVGLTESGAGR